MDNPREKSSKERTMNNITIFQAKKIVTMNPPNSEATHVAVRDGIILGAGTLNELKEWGDYTLDTTFRDKVLVPGLIEAHAHILEGAMAQFPYVGYFDKRQPDGSIAPGIQSVDALIARLKEIDAAMPNPDDVLIAQGFDPIYFSGERVNRTHLDLVSTTRPIFLLHASGHLATVNTAMLNKHNITRETNVEGVAKDANGEPNGELQEVPAMSLASSALGAILHAMGSEQAIWNFGYAARNAGITTVSDLAGTVITEPKTLASWQRVVNDESFPARVNIYNLPALPGGNADYAQVAARVRELQTNEASDKLHFPGVKFVIDGSIQGFTAVLNEPGYFHGEDHGLLLTVPEQFKDWMLPFHKAGINISVHCNGDKTVDIFLDAVEGLLKEVAWLDHRHTCQHSQLTTSAQYRRMAKLGVCANLFANHIWYWGDQHYEITVGPERANRMEASLVNFKFFDVL
jgi:predicted amidohydrolase YtcJ